MGGGVGEVGVLNDQKQQTLEGRNSWVLVGWGDGAEYQDLGGEVG